MIIHGPYMIVYDPYMIIYGPCMITIQHYITLYAPIRTLIGQLEGPGIKHISNLTNCSVPGPKKRTTRPNHNHDTACNERALLNTYVLQYW